MMRILSLLLVSSPLIRLNFIKATTYEDEAMTKLQDNMESLIEAFGGGDTDDEYSKSPSGIFPLDKSKLH